jgi:hypothetical protein
VRQQPAIADHLHEVRGDWFAGDRFAGGEVLNLARLGIDAQPVVWTDALRLRAHERRQAEVERVAVKEPGEGLGDERPGPEMLERLRRLLAGWARAAIARATGRS